MPKKMTIWEYIERIAALWGLVTMIVTVLHLVGWLPFYNIYYKRKTEITPVVSVYPSAQIRLSAEFADSVEPQKIKNVMWNIKYSSGEEYNNLSQARELDIILLPDLSGILNLGVKAKLYEEEKERHGAASIHVVQAKPHKLSYQKSATFALPAARLEEIDLSTVQLYGGTSEWLTAYQFKESQDSLRLSAKERSFPTWNGRAYLRYKPKNNQTGGYHYESLTALDTDYKNTPQVQLKK